MASYCLLLFVNIANTLCKQDVFVDATHLIHGQDQATLQSSVPRSLTDHESVQTPRTEVNPPIPFTPKDSRDDKNGNDGSHHEDHKDQDGQEDHHQEDIANNTPPPSDTEDTPRRRRLQKSPLLTTHRLSTSSLDDVNLMGNKENDMVEVSDPVPKPSLDPIPLPPNPTDQASKQNPRPHGFPANIPSVLWAMNKNPPHPLGAIPSAPTAPSRKLTSPFSWLSKSASSKDIKSPPTYPADAGRRNTAASISTLNSTLHEGDETDRMSTGSRRPGRSSLKDQFKLLRMREEGYFPENDQASIASGRASIGGIVGTPTSAVEEKENGPISPSVFPCATNPNLAPGTVSGISACLSDASAPVDWELWQHIVNHGPEALTGANAAELNAAIKRGIPQTIRGVIWQVLSDSRNTDLEDVYRELVVRGTDKERDGYLGVNSHTNGSILEKEKELFSSQSPVLPDKSATTPESAISLSWQEKDIEKLIKEKAGSEAARQRKAKEEVEAIRKLEKVIRRDLGARTSYSKYFISQGNQEALFGLCKAYALYDAAVGYAQGINFIAMPLLFNMDEGEAFTLLVKLMNKYGLRDMFIQDMPGLHLHLYQFERLLEDLEPALYCHLRRRSVTPQLYATQWFLTLFVYRFPLQLVLRIYDLIFEEGLESTILRFGVAIMRRNAMTLLGMKDMNTLSTFLKEKLFDVYIDQQPSATSILESGFFGSSSGSDKEIYRADVMVQDACAVPLTLEMIKMYTEEWGDKVKVEKDREVELEGLRHAIASQTGRIRSLEEHAEKSDKEHVQLASELVRVKVKNGELSDKNESLGIQVDELKQVIDKQPAEVEEKLRTEMDRIMKRNIEVQNENRAIEESMAEMEKSLVKTKMQLAELSEEHETLRQKWADLRKALD
ncbi:Rab-GTPase-TBC domain containing protein [Elaphomyces granulatus]